MYRKWIDRMGIEPIYAEVREQVQAANAYLDAREQEAQTRAASRLDADPDRQAQRHRSAGVTRRRPRPTVRSSG
jgi:hypothetical protein